MRHFVMLLMLVITILASTTGHVSAARCNYGPPQPCGIWPGDCSLPLFWTECCCFREPCDDPWAGCQPWGFDCSTVVSCGS
jgi:hypothetical protein